MTPLTSGFCCTSAGGRPLRVGSLLFSGAGGSVYEADWDGWQAVLKLPAPSAAGAQMPEEMADQVEAGSPDDNFLWPGDLVEIDGLTGWVLPPRPPGYVPAPELLADPARHDVRTLALAGRHLALSLARLHLLGYAFRDFALGDVLVDPATGGVRLDVASRIAVDGEPKPKAGRKPRFLAPEMVRGEALPGVETDLHVLATALFTLLFAAHPFDGQLVSPPAPARGQSADDRLPPFLFHPQPQAGQPSPDERTTRLWKAAPKRVRQCFGQTFTRGVQQPTTRPSVGDWCVVLTALLDSLFPCGRCEAVHAFCPARAAAGGPPETCRACGGVLTPPPRLVLAGGTLPRHLSPRPYPLHASAARPGLLEFPEHVVVLTKDTRLHAFHTVSPLRIDFARLTAQVSPVVERPGELALFNLGEEPWNFSSGPDGVPESVPSGRRVPLQPGIDLDFGAVTGRIVG